MNPTIYQWALRHGVSQQALSELVGIMTAPVTDPSRFVPGLSEAAVSNNVMLEASRCGARLWRCNTGACKDERGRLIRYGLCNTSKKMNEQLKCSDLIGIKPVLITPDHVGSFIGQFIARECKRGGWEYTSNKHEEAQLRFMELVVGLGGDACFVTGEGSL